MCDETGGVACIRLMETNVYEHKELHILLYYTMHAIPTKIQTVGVPCSVSEMAICSSVQMTTDV